MVSAPQTQEAPVLTYDVCQTIAIGENKDGAENVRKDDLSGDFAKNKYVCFAPAEHTGGTATCTNKAVCINCSKEYGEHQTIPWPIIRL